MERHIFREYDIRGVVDRDLTEDVVRNVGRAFGTHLRRRGGRAALVGGDVRHSTERFRRALTEGLLSTGINVVDAGVVPTPAFYFGLHERAVDGGVMITGSHNPPDMNGLKLNAGTDSMYGAEIQELWQIAQRGDFESGRGTRTETALLDAYKDAIRSRISLARPLKVVVDAGNGCAGLVACDLIKSLGCEVVPLYCEPDGDFPNHHPDPTVPEYVKDLIAAVVRHKADVGIGYDGDADRVGTIDEKGEMVFADKVLALLAREVLAAGPAEIVFDVKCSQALIEDIEAHGGKPLMWKTGHSLLKRKIKETGAPIGGEMSGHMVLADGYYPFDDAIYASCRILQMLSRAAAPLSELVATIPRYHSTPEIRGETKDDATKFEIVRKAVEYFRSHHDVIDVDGVRIQFGDGWGLVRASNTQPVIVMRFEARTESRLREIQALVTGKLREFGEIRL
ncbi:MAG: phosphomannomutase/phosphoglucomutase [Candidatus Eisenbacteria bacterium]|nr:phosphomannomutase/phosphoglucomutase [Candidatus Eisenbacteria bacterium]